MSSITLALSEALREVADAPSVTTVAGGLGNSGYERHDREQAELPVRQAERQTPLARRYQRQIRWRAKYRQDLVAKMATHVAYTLLPGDYASDFSALVGDERTGGKKVPLAGIKHPRLVVSYRFPEGSDPHSGIAVVGYQVSVDRKGHAYFGGAQNATFAKNAAIKPHNKAGGAALGVNRDAVLLRTALELDWATECAADDRIETVTEFLPPPIILGFPLSYWPRPEATAAMDESVCRAFSDGGPPLRSLVTEKGGFVLTTRDEPNGLKLVKLEAEGNVVDVRFPRWLSQTPLAMKGVYLKPGTVIADLPRFGNKTTTMRDVIDKVSPKDVEWLARRLLDEATEIVVVDEKVYDRSERTFVTETRTWRCVPLSLVPGQVNRAVGKYLDMRGLLGRELPDPNDQYKQAVRRDPASAVIRVKKLAERPTKEGLRTEDPNGAWSMDLSSLPGKFGWLTRQRDGTD